MDSLDYDYKVRKKEIEDILDEINEIKEVERFPVDKEFTYSNGYKAFTTSIFVDLRNSTKLFTEEDDISIAKVIRGFTSEVIEILRKNTTSTELKEIGIRGDCVFAVYSTPLNKDDSNIANRAFYINTYLKMLNKLLEDRKLPTIKAGIGVASSKTLAVKAGRKDTGINNLVWIGNAVSKAAKLSDFGNKDGIKGIVMDEYFFHNCLRALSTDKSNNWKKWFAKGNDSDLGVYYHADIVKVEFSQWIDDGMP